MRLRSLNWTEQVEFELRAIYRWIKKEGDGLSLPRAKFIFPTYLIFCSSPVMEIEKKFVRYTTIISGGLWGAKLLPSIGGSQNPHL